MPFSSVNLPSWRSTQPTKHAFGQGRVAGGGRRGEVRVDADVPAPGVLVAAEDGLGGEVGEVEGPDIISVNDSCFEEFVAGSSRRLFTMARLLTGGHRAEAED